MALGCSLRHGLRRSASILGSVLDLVFPPDCLACGAVVWDGGSQRLCARCRARVPATVLRCRRCGRRVGPHGVGPGCTRCAGPLATPGPLTLRDARGASASGRPLYRVLAAFEYAGTARALVLALKFGGRPEAGRPLASAMADVLAAADVPGDLLVPVPLSRGRQRRRGYNQAHVLARGVAHRLSLPLDARALRRRRETVPQASLSRAARRRGPRGAFRARRRRVGGRCVLLVDDVLTSGATARACALALRRAGALSVACVVACRTESA